MHSDLHKQFAKVFINGKEAKWDGFAFLRLHQSEESAVLLTSFQMKFAEPDSKNSQTINRQLVDTEFHKAFQAYESLARNQDFPQTEWTFVILSNAQRASGLSDDDLPSQCAVVDRSIFQAFYGQTFASRAQFAAVGSKIFLNSARLYELKLIRGVGNTIAEAITSERKKRKFENADDLCKRVPKFPRKEVNSIVVP
jgi:DNA uptake protein ComE-like DNA-binding protein